jgi:hypothetical protein
METWDRINDTLGVIVWPAVVVTTLHRHRAVGRLELLIVGVLVLERVQY